MDSLGVAFSFVPQPLLSPFFIFLICLFHHLFFQLSRKTILIFHFTKRVRRRMSFKMVWKIKSLTEMLLLICKISWNNTLQVKLLTLVVCSGSRSKYATSRIHWFYLKHCLAAIYVIVRLFQELFYSTMLPTRSLAIFPITLVSRVSILW